MKKLLYIMLAGMFSMALSVGSTSAASSDCLNVRFSNGDNVCLELTKNGSRNFELSANRNNLERNSAIRCYIILPDSTIRSFNNCKGSFSYAGGGTEETIVSATYVTRNNNFYSKRISTEVNFSKGRWTSNRNTTNPTRPSSTTNRHNDDLEISASPSNPDTYEWVKLSISTDDDYVGKINFSKFQYRSTSSSSRSNISRTSSTYVSDYSDDWSNGYYRMKTTDKGEVALKNLIKFKKSGYYKIYVEDTDGQESYVQIKVGTSNSSSSDSNDRIELSTNRKSPSTSQYVNLTIKTNKDYTGRLSLSAKYRKSSSDSWSSISNTSSTYFYDYSDEWEDGYYRMISSDRGEITIGDIVKFKKSGYYRIYVRDIDGNENYIQFDVSTASSSNDNDELKVTASPSNPDTYEWINLTVKTNADYDAIIKISKLQYRSSNSSSRSNINDITSSTYVSDYSNIWSNSYHRIVTDEDGKATLKNIAKFKKSGYYRIYIEDTDDNESYVQINVDVSKSSSQSNNNSNEIELSTNRKSPSTDQYVNLTIETDNDYVGKLSLSAKYRNSSSSSWSNISNTSSTYFSDYSEEREDGYYKMRSSDKGEVTLKNIVKFKKSGYYRVYVQDTEGNEAYIQFYVETADDDDDSEVAGFTVSQLEKVKKVYKEWDNVIGQMQRKYPSLKRDTYRIKLSDNFYDDMEDVINNKRYRDFQDYDDFKDAFNEWYKYTLRNI